MNEIIFLVEEAPEGGYTAKALNHSVFSEGNDFDELKKNVKEAVLCHFEADQLPKIVRLHFVREETFAIAS